ncbi:MAG: NADPH-dependent assimilatory sulfite reductase hemoprotein subunit [Rickettsiales bacterium]|nr:NADPH-dependent assimilatory sulfite reductase hemoprotein subunit [Rickettsiales bacterium]
MSDKKKLSPVEGIKLRSRNLRGGLSDGLQNQLTGAIDADDQQLIKFHGSYMQDDRDRRAERERKKLEPAYSFMIRLRIPGGDITHEQWRGIQDCADTHANGIVKITTRQTVQLHGVVKAHMKPTYQWFDRLGLDAIAACGDVNRNVVAGSNPAIADYHKDVFEFADKISEHLLPQTGAFREVWLDGEKLEGEFEAKEDPLYQNRYLPRKFKIGIAIPPHNDTDIFTQDIGLIAIEEEGTFRGFNIAVGGGLGCTHGNPNTYPRAGTVIGFVEVDQTLDAVWEIAAVQRDFGNREDRKQARLKYTVDRMGVDEFVKELQSRLSFPIQEAKPYEFTHRGDPYGWVPDADGLWYYTLYVEHGRVRDLDDYPVKTALSDLADLGVCGFRFTANQNVMLTNIEEANKAQVIELLERHNILQQQDDVTEIHKQAIACVALPTCPLALAEAQRYLPELLDKVHARMDKHGIGKEEITIRMTGCPNGCARPYAAEIGFIGKSAGRYNMHIGGDYEGYRLNTLYREEIDEAEILESLDSMFGDFVEKREEGERFGDFTKRFYLDAKVAA